MKMVRFIVALFHHTLELFFDEICDLIARESVSLVAWVSDI